jgi:hypothetical protein
MAAAAARKQARLPPEVNRCALVAAVARKAARAGGAPSFVAPAGHACYVHSAAWLFRCIPRSRPAHSLVVQQPRLASAGTPHPLPLPQKPSAAPTAPHHLPRVLYVRNLPFNISSEEMYEIFGRYGAIRQIRV